MESEQLFLRPKDAAARLGIGLTKLGEFLRTGELESVSIGSRTRLIPADALEDFAERLRNGKVNS